MTTSLPLATDEALLVLTDGRGVGDQRARRSWQDRVLSEVAQQWTAVGLGEVIGIIASQSARNTSPLGAGVLLSVRQERDLPSRPVSDTQSRTGTPGRRAE